MARKHSDAPPHTARYVIFQSNMDMKWYWKVTAGNGHTVNIGGEGFRLMRLAHASMERAIIAGHEAQAHPVVIMPLNKPSTEMVPPKVPPNAS
jgi:hypothetical protein